MQTRSASDELPGLDSFQLDRLERNFLEWANSAKRADIKLSRRRIYLIFLLIRYAGGKLGEVLAVDPLTDIDVAQKIVLFRRPGVASVGTIREVPIPESLCAHVRTMLAIPGFHAFLKESGMSIDPGFVRRKFYERAHACGIDTKRGAPEAIRQSRAVELMMNNMPLPAVQSLMGHSNPAQTAAHVSFSEDDIRQVIRLFMEKESNRKTSARNAFFGKITQIRKGDIQSMVELETMRSGTVTTVITNNSLARLGLVEGQIITAEVKAPWVTLHKSDREPECSAENRFTGIVNRIHTGGINSEYIIRISDETELCAIVNTDRARKLGINEQDSVWAVFSSNAVVLHLD